MIEIPGYTIEKQLGRGGMARVYLARHTGLDRLVAIKVLSKDLHGDKSFSERFMREARIVANLTHQNIITVYDVGVHNEHHYIAMEYLPGETLDDKVKKKLGIKQILGIIKQIASALDFAHKKGIVHRDVKPDNILFREDGTAVLTDFGIARAAKSETKMTATGTVIGTPHYMSPEQAQGQEIGPWSDLYSLGIVLFEMFNGEVPFDADSTIAVVFKHITEPVPDLAEPYQKYQPLVNTLLAKEPAERYQSGREVIADIECLDRGDTPANATLIFNQTAINPAVSLNTDKKTVQTNQPASSKRNLFAGIALTAIVIIAAGAMLFLNRTNSTLTTNPGNSQQATKPDSETLMFNKRRLQQEKLNTENAQLKAQQLEAQKLEAQKFEAEKLEQQRLASKNQQLEQRQQETLLREKNEELAQAEAETRRAKQELQALKQKQREAKVSNKIPETNTAVKQPVTETPAQKQVANNTGKVSPAPVATAESKTGILSSWLGDAEDTTDEYINDSLRAADTALDNNRYASARQNYERVLQHQPGNLRAKQGLEKIKQQVTTRAAASNDAYTLDLLKAADNALKTDRLSSASYNYQKVLKQSPNNEHATNGLNDVFNRHLQLALEEAKDDDFDDAAEHFVAAEKLRPNDKKLKSVSREIAQLRKK